MTGARGRPRGPRKVSASIDAALVAGFDKTLERMRAMIGPGLKLTRTDLLEYALKAYLREQTVCSTDPADAVLADSPRLASPGSKFTSRQKRN